MKLPPEADSKGLRADGPVPQDVKRAVELMRTSVCDPLSMATLAERCGVPQRTLNEHFRVFMGLSPMEYFRRLRLAAVREVLLGGEPGASVAEAAGRFRFHHFGRFAELYRRRFGEPPSATLRNARAAAPSQSADKQVDAAALDEGGGTELRSALPSRQKPSIVILPCQASKNEPVLQRLAMNLAEGIAAALSSVSSLAVIGPASSHATTRNPLGSAREAGAQYLMTGRIDQAGAQLRCILRVVRTKSKHSVWGESFDGLLDQPFELESHVIARVLGVLPPCLRSSEIELALETPPRSLDTHGLSMRALPFLFASRPDAARRALDLLHQAIEADPDYGLSTALAAWGHGQLVMYNGTPAPSEERQRAEEFARRASLLADHDPIALTARSAVHTMKGELDVAEVLVTRALALDPTSGWAWGRSAWLHSYRGNSERAIAQFDHAIACDPRASRANSLIGIGSAHFNAGRYEEAACFLRSGLLEQPDATWANRSLSVSYARLGERSKALQSLEALRRSRPDLTVGQVIASVPFQPSYLDRLGDGLTELGLPT